ncbi:MAG: glycosyltransferase family 39 protein, partial [Patescibacteria group bacterium]
MHKFFEYLKSLPSKTWFWLALSICFAIAVMVFDFAIFGLYQDKNDTQSYMDVIAYFDGRPAPVESGQLTLFHIRLLKPLYGIICSSLTPLFSPYQAMLLLDMTLYFGTIILLFILLKKYFNLKSSMAALGTVWFACSYPMLKYGFSLMTDISGYFFILLTVLLALIGFTKNKYIYFFAAGMAAGIGITAKESGAFGLLFIFIYSLIQIRKTGTIKTLKRLLLVALPFLLIFGLSQILIIYKTNYSYLNFFTLSENEYAA